MSKHIPVQNEPIPECFIREGEKNERMAFFFNYSTHLVPGSKIEKVKSNDYKFQNCDLSGSNLHETNLRGANLKGASLELMQTPVHMCQTVANWSFFYVCLYRELNR